MKSINIYSKKWVGRDNVKKVSINTFYRIDDVNEVCHVFVSSFSSSGTKTAVLADFASVVSANTSNYPYIIYNHFGVNDENDDVESDVKDCIDYIKTTLGKTIIAWISGHRHVDWVKAYNDTLIICLLNSGWYGSDKENQDEHSYPKTVNTSTESLFSVLTFVPTTGKVFITRFGAGVDMECNYNTTSGAVGRIGYLPPTSTYSITNTLSGGVKNSNSATTISGGSTYNATLSVPDSHYTFGTVTVTMGGTDITSTAYDSSTHAISIASVSGDIVITATATNDYYWTPENATITQFNSYRPATLLQTGNDIDLGITQIESGVKITKAVPTISPTGNVTFTIKADSVQWSSPDDSYTFTLKIYWLDSNGTMLTQKDMGYNQTFADDYYDAIVNGLDTTINTSTFSNWSSVASVQVEMRATSQITNAGVPASLILSNFRIELKSA